MPTRDYDYEEAERHGLKPGPDGHWQSRAPNGRILKSPRHRTFHLTIEGERKAGMQFYRKDGELYSDREVPPGGRPVSEKRLKRKYLRSVGRGGR